MGKINQAGRHYEVFDPFNKKHRQIFHEALKYKTWGRSPVRFWLDETTDNLMDQCTKKIAKYYLLKEFGKLENDEPFEGVRIRPNPDADAVKRSQSIDSF